MKKLFNLKEWLTIDDAARYLSIVFNEQVSRADVLRLGLDARITLSVNFVNPTQGRIGHIVSMESARMDVISFDGVEETQSTWLENVLRSDLSAFSEEIKDGLESGYLTFIPRGDAIDENQVVEYTDHFSPLKGIWDLPMIGGEKLYVEHEYQQITGGPEVTISRLDRAFVKSPDGKLANILESYDNSKYQKGSLAALNELKILIASRNMEKEEADGLLKAHKFHREDFLEKIWARPESESYFPSGGLPRNSVLVIRVSALHEFEVSLKRESDQINSALKPTERNSLLTIIAALCKKSGIDPKSRGASKQVSDLTEKMGAPVSDDTVRRAFDKIPDALESRMK